MPGDGDGEVINCALDFTKATKKCLEEEAAAAAQESDTSPTTSQPAVSPAARRHGRERQAVLPERRAESLSVGLAQVKRKKLRRCNDTAALCN